MLCWMNKWTVTACVEVFKFVMFTLFCCDYSYHYLPREFPPTNVSCIMRYFICYNKCFILIRFRIFENSSKHCELLCQRSRDTCTSLTTHICNCSENSIGPNATGCIHKVAILATNNRYGSVNFTTAGNKLHSFKHTLKCLCQGRIFCTTSINSWFLKIFPHTK